MDSWYIYSRVSRQTGKRGSVLAIKFIVTELRVLQAIAFRLFPSAVPESDTSVVASAFFSLVKMKITRDFLPLSPFFQSLSTGPKLKSHQ